MARIKGPRKVHRYSAEFKLKAVKLSQIEGVQVQDVADALDIHPFMLSRWRKEAREGRLKARVRVWARIGGVELHQQDNGVGTSTQVEEADHPLHDPMQRLFPGLVRPWRESRESLA
jgi:transposase-like protein